MVRVPNPQEIRIAALLKQLPDHKLDRTLFNFAANTRKAEDTFGFTQKNGTTHLGVKYLRQLEQLAINEADKRKDAFGRPRFTD